MANTYRTEMTWNDRNGNVHYPGISYEEEHLLTLIAAADIANYVTLGHLVIVPDAPTDSPEAASDVSVTDVPTDTGKKGKGK